jgi:hypothetical protein
MEFPPSTHQVLLIGPEGGVVGRSRDFEHPGVGGPEFPHDLVEGDVVE